jgi:5,5'-dehydrodivanillate O-demethylase
MQSTERPARIAADAHHGIDLSHTGPDTPAGRYYRRFWVPVAELESIKPGRGKSVLVMGERVTVYRGESGVPHVIANFCAHRGTRLSTGWIEGDCIRCLYHGWLYDAQGQCVEQPGETAGFADKISVRSYPTQSWVGLIFAYFGEDEPPPLPQPGEWQKASLVENRNYLRQSNYLNSRENGSDWLHVRFTHRRSAFTDAGFNREIPEYDAVETDYGIRGYTRFSDGKYNVHHVLLPFMAYNIIFDDVAGWVKQLGWRIPIDDENTQNYTVRLIEKSGADLDRYLEDRQRYRDAAKDLQPAQFYVDACLNGEMHVDEVPLHHPQLVNIQDAVVLNAQPALNDRDDRLGRSDVEVILLRKLLAREIQANELNQPVKSWQWTEEQVVETGI